MIKIEIKYLVSTKGFCMVLCKDKKQILLYKFIKVDNFQCRYILGTKN